MPTTKNPPHCLHYQLNSKPFITRLSFSPGFLFWACREFAVIILCGASHHTVNLRDLFPLFNTDCMRNKFARIAFYTPELRRSNLAWSPSSPFKEPIHNWSKISFHNWYRGQLSFGYLRLRVRLFVLNCLLMRAPYYYCLAWILKSSHFIVSVARLTE